MVDEGWKDPAQGVRFRVLGPLQVTVDDTPVVLGGAKQQMVLAVLLLNAGQVVSADRIIESVWGEDANDRGAGNLQVYVSNLRRALAVASERLGHHVIETQRPGYVVRVDAVQLDQLGFERYRSEGERAWLNGDAAGARAAFRLALDLWTGEPLAGLDLDPSWNGVVTGLQRAQLATMVALADTELATGRHREFLDQLSTWCTEHPLDERLRGQLMLALYRCGLQADALREFADARERLLDELGIDPSRELRELEDQILRQDSALDLRRPGATIGDDIDEGSPTVVRSSLVQMAAELEIDGITMVLSAATTTIGRRSDRDISLDDPGVSRTHAEIQRGSGVFRIVDHGSANGTRVNGQPVSDSLLQDGDVIEVGATMMRFRMLDA